MPTTADIYAALSQVEDPEIHRSLTELNMVESVNLKGEKLALGIKLTVAGCPTNSVKPYLHTDSRNS